MNDAFGTNKVFWNPTELKTCHSYTLTDFSIPFV